MKTPQPTFKDIPSQLLTTKSTNTKKRFTSYLRISCITVLFFSTSFGVIIIKDLSAPHPPKTDFGFALVLFIPPLFIAVILALISSLTLIFMKPDKEVNKLVDLSARILSIPVLVFGILFAVATAVGIIKHF